MNAVTRILTSSAMTTPGRSACPSCDVSIGSFDSTTSLFSSFSIEKPYTSAPTMFATMMTIRMKMAVSRL